MMNITGRKIPVRISVRRQVGFGTRWRPYTIVVPSRDSGRLLPPRPPRPEEGFAAAAGSPRGGLRGGGRFGSRALHGRRLGRLERLGLPAVGAPLAVARRLLS